jgi:hypothetical protein
MIVIGGLQFPGYDWLSQTVSELSAIGAPSRPLWVALGLVYDVLMIAFGMGIRAAAGANRSLRIAGVLLIAFGAIGFAWPPMNPRGVPFGANDAGHIAFAAVAVLLMLSAIGFGAAALGRRFRVYSIATLGVHLIFGALAWLDAPRIAQNLPTPWAGVTERVNIAVFLLWVAVLAVATLRGERDAAARAANDPGDKGARRLVTGRP